MARLLEVCTGSVESVIAARDGGAARFELCSALEVGGITPSVGLMRLTREVKDIAMHVLIRPRGGDFLYNEAEIQCMEQDIIAARDCGADGVVIGALTADGNIDTTTCSRLVKAAQGMNITFHRAFDMCCDPFRALEEIIELGCNRILTSGLAATAEAGIPLIKRLVTTADGRIMIMPGCGVNATNAARILQETGATEIHASARKSVGSAMLFRHSGVSMGNPDSDEFARKETDTNEVRAIVDAIMRI
ncbi:MAG: copper homeostasis protein CutC [Bacteroidaceae bacterium]|nr:copper homeostasis protein CutC [Bacteroidaceae bacterium]